MNTTDSTTQFCLMLAAMMDDDWAEVARQAQEEHNPEDWGLDDDDLAEARTDYADFLN